MKKSLLLLFLFLGFAKLISAQENPNWTQVQAKMDSLVSHGVPGVSFGVKTKNLEWYQTAGLSKLETSKSMEPFQLHYLQSISKTYLATAVLLLAESGQIDLDQAVAKYLPASTAQLVDQSDKMTVRMLMNHTSGIPEYNYLPEYLTMLLQVENNPFEPIDYIRYLEGKKVNWEPGTRYSYRNSGFVLLALMVDHVTGDHAQFIQEKILDPLDLKCTFYRNTLNYLENPRLVDAYWDRYSNGKIENVNTLQKNNVKAMVGDDGLITDSKDGLKFLEALLSGKIIQESSLAQMKTWVNDRNGNPTYGLGLDKSEIAGREAWGHSGGGLGAGVQLYYFPEYEAYIFMAINLGTVTSGPIHDVAEPIVESIYQEVFKVVKK